MRNLALVWVLAGCLLGCGGKDKAAPASDTTDTAAVETDTTATEKAYVKQGLLRNTLIISSTDSGASVSSRDTLIALSAGWAVHFSKYDEKMGLWYNPRIVNLNKKDTVTIKNLSYENGSELFIAVSPNSFFFVLDDIDKGYVETDEDTILHENFFCVIIDIKNAKVVESMQTHCSGEWDNKNNWVSGNDIIFTSD